MNCDWCGKAMGDQPPCVTAVTCSPDCTYSAITGKRHPEAKPVRLKYLRLAINWTVAVPLVAAGVVAIATSEAFSGWTKTLREELSEYIGAIKSGKFADYAPMHFRTGERFLWFRSKVSDKKTEKKK